MRDIAGPLTAGFLAVGLGLFVMLAATHVASAEPAVLCVWGVLGALLVGALVCSIRLCGSLRAAAAGARCARVRQRDAEAKADRWQGELEALQKKHLEKLSTAVQDLLGALQERGQELDEEENWWKGGGQRDEP